MFDRTPAYNAPACPTHLLHGISFRGSSRSVPNTHLLMPDSQAKYATGIPFKRNAHEANKWNPLFHERSSIPEEALKKTTGVPEGGGELRVTRYAVRAILRLLSLRTSPRLRRWVKNSFIISITCRYEWNEAISTNPQLWVSRIGRDSDGQEESLPRIYTDFTNY